MEDVFSTHDLSTGSDVGYDTLEAYIVETSRKQERKRREKRGDISDEVRTTVRLERWQENEIDSIRDSLKTSGSNVVNRAYIYGLEDLRDRLEHLEHAATIGGRIQNVIKNDTTDEERYSSFYRRYKELECNVDTTPQNSLSEQPTHVSVFGSILEEVTDTFNRDLHIDGSVHRIIVGVGLMNSKNIGRLSEQYSQTMLDSLREGIQEYRYELEGFVDRYTRWSMQDWREQGIDKRTHNELQEITQSMETEYADTVKSRVQTAEEFIEGGE